MKIPKPSHRETIALFRLSVIGDLLAVELTRGELKTEFIARAARRYRPPGIERTRKYHWKTLQRWYYDAKDGPADALEPQSRARGHARRLTAEQRELLIQMRVEHRSVAAEILLSEAIRHGIVAKDQVSLSTVRRLLAAAELSRLSRRRADRSEVQRRRWQAAAPGDLWHGDVCHIGLVDDAGRAYKALVHAFLDDASRYVVALVARAQEREVDMLEVLCGVLLRHPAPKRLYLDNGATYSGSVLPLICKRLDIRLIHATAYSPEARGEQERFWRTMRQRCTDLLPPTATLHQVNQALWAWLDTDYNRRPHGGLFGETPRRRYLDSLPKQRAPLSVKTLSKALEVETTRKVRKDATFSIDSTIYEVTGRHLAGKEITVVIDGLTGQPIRATYQDHALRFGVCDPVKNAHRERPPAPPPDKTRVVPFDPIAAMLQKAREVGDE